MEPTVKSLCSTKSNAECDDIFVTFHAVNLKNTTVYNNSSQCQCSISAWALLHCCINILSIPLTVGWINLHDVLLLLTIHSSELIMTFWFWLWESEFCIEDSWELDLPQAQNSMRSIWYSKYLVGLGQQEWPFDCKTRNTQQHSRIWIKLEGRSNLLHNHVWQKDKGACLNTLRSIW